jgi:hypothetical protein
VTTGGGWTRAPKEWARQWLTDGAPLRDYVPVRVPAGGVVHRATLRWAGGALDVSDRQWTLGYAPVALGIALPPALSAELLAAPSGVRLTITGPPPGSPPGSPDALGGVRSVVTLRPLRAVPGGVLLFEAGEARIGCLDPVRRALLLRHLHAACVRRDRHFGGMTPLRYRQYAAQFCFPRPVVLVCTPAGRTFPIDLWGQAADTVVLGIRSSNAAVDELRSCRTLALCAVDGVHQPEIYALGKMGGAPSEPAARPGGLRRTARFGIPVPDLAAGWREVRVEHDEPLGVQRLFCGVVEEEVPADVAPLHHHHLLAWLQDQREGGRGYAPVA